MPKAPGKKKRSGAKYKRKQYGKSTPASIAAAEAGSSPPPPKLSTERREALRRYLKEPVSSLLWDVVSHVDVGGLLNQPLTGKKRHKYRPPQPSVALK